MDDLFKLLPGLIKSLPDSPEVREAVVFSVWRKAAGDTLRAHTIPIELDKRKLKLAVRDKIWKRNLESMAPQLLFRLNALLESSRVGFLEFEVNEEMFESKNDDSGAVNLDENMELPPVPPELVEKAAAISDPGLRKRFLEAAAVYLEMREIRGRK